MSESYTWVYCTDVFMPQPTRVTMATMRPGKGEELELTPSCEFIPCPLLVMLPNETPPKLGSRCLLFSRRVERGKRNVPCMWPCTMGLFG